MRVTSINLDYQQISLEFRKIKLGDSLIFQETLNALSVIIQARSLILNLFGKQKYKTFTV